MAQASDQNMRPRVYVETSIISYLTSRPSRDPVVAGHQQVTREWRDERHGRNCWRNRGMWEDPIVAEIRKIREEHAARFNYNLQAMFDDLKEGERKSGRKFVSYPPRAARPVDLTGAARKA
jgi:hypothetical protein